MIYRFLDQKGTFAVRHPHQYNLYFPLTDKDGKLLSAISPYLSGDIKKDNARFLTLPASIEDIRSNLLCRREFFIKTDKKIIRLSNPYNDTLEAGLLYHKIRKKAGPLHIEVTNFIPYNIPVEVMRIRVINKGKKAVSITPTSFLPLFGRSEKNLRDHRHVSSLLNRVELSDYGISLRPAMIFNEEGHQLNETLYFTLGYENKTVPPAGQFPTLDSFLGKGDITSPEAVTKDKIPFQHMDSQFDGKEVCAAFRFTRRVLNKDEETGYFLIMGIDTDKQNILNVFAQLNTPQKVQTALAETQRYWVDYLAQVRLDFKNPLYNNWLLWVQLQPVLRKLFGCSFLPHFDYGKGGRGWRDIWQDTLTLLVTEPAKASILITNNFQGIRLDGSNATIITPENTFISDRNRINRVWMDHGIWPYLTLSFYIHRTGDLDILRRPATYFRDHQLKRAREVDTSFTQKDFVLRTRDNQVYQGSILEHLLVQTLVQFFNTGQHNIIRLENADWNDGLDMAAKHGESAAFSFMYAHNLDNLCVFLEELKKKNQSVSFYKELFLLLDRLNTPVDYNQWTEKQQRLNEYFEKTKTLPGEKQDVLIDDLISDLKAKSRHLSSWLNKTQWIEEGFFNGYYDNKGNPVEGVFNGQTRMMLQSQVFAIMSGMVEEKRIRQIWQAAQKNLRDNKLGGFRLNTNFHSLYTDLGRAFGFSYGDKENGAFFNHMAVMFAYSLYKQGFIQEGREVFNSIFLMAGSPFASIYPVLPEYFNNEGKGLYLYLTGSASWYIYTLLQEILGIKFFFGDLVLEPKLTTEDFSKKTIETTFNFHNKKIKVIFARGQKTSAACYTIKNVLLENQPLPHAAGRCLIKKELLLAVKKEPLILKIYL
ncbi:MAG: cellobiose phosphorylase [Candidatus Omnitrophota bacterium]